MAISLTIYDETLPGERTASLPAGPAFFHHHPARADPPPGLRGSPGIPRRPALRRLSRPGHALADGSRLERPKARTRTKRRLDWEAQYEKALSAFARNGFFVLVGDRQVESLDEEITLKVDTEVSFVKLVALVGG